MSDKDEASHNSNADRNPAIADGKAGLVRLEQAIKRILQVPKKAIDKKDEDR